MTADRLYLQYVPDDEGRRQLVGLQDDLHRLCGGRRANRRELHMTLLHVGVIEEVWGELRRYRRDLELAEVRAEMKAFAGRSEALMPAHVTVYTDGLEGFGPHGDVVVLRIVLDEELRRIHRICLEVLVDTLGRLLGSEPRSFMRASPNLRFTLDAKPHLTLLRKSAVPALVPELPAALQLTAVPPLYNLK